MIGRSSSCVRSPVVVKGPDCLLARASVWPGLERGINDSYCPARFLRLANECKNCRSHDRMSAMGPVMVKGPDWSGARYQSGPLALTLPPAATEAARIAALICSGLSNKLIARQLDLSEGTVKQHVHHILLKLGTHNRYRLTMLLNGNNALRDEGGILD